MASQVEPACHKASLDEAGTLTDPDATDQDGKSTDDQADSTRGLGPHLKLIAIG
jgi:hypothetical protein